MCSSLADKGARKGGKSGHCTALMLYINCEAEVEKWCRCFIRRISRRWDKEGHSSPSIHCRLDYKSRQTKIRTRDICPPRERLAYWHEEEARQSELWPLALSKSRRDLMKLAPFHQMMTHSYGWIMRYHEVILSLLVTPFVISPVSLENVVMMNQFCTVISQNRPLRFYDTDTRFTNAVDDQIISRQEFLRSSVSTHRKEKLPKIVDIHFK
jgi:hypothetical protein